MRYLSTPPLALALLSVATTGIPQTPSAAARTDVYHVHFTKAVPGQAAALAKILETGNPQAAMPGHFIVLRHQEGDDWDFCVIEHLGTKASVDAAPAPPNPGRDLRAWHTDTFVSGPAWAEFSRAMGTDSGDKTKSSVYTAAVWRPVPGHREQLEEALNRTDPASKAVGQVLMQHLEGGPWLFLAITRHNSWQDFAADQTATAPAAGSAQDTWSEVRQHSTYHHDTLADRIAPK